MQRERAEPRMESYPGPNARRWVDYHQSLAAPSEYSHEFVWDVTGDAVGPFVSDVDGNVLLDFTCHIGAAPLGYNNPKILDRMREFDLVDPLKIAGQDMYFGSGDSPAESRFPGASHLMEKLTEISSHYGMDTVFLSNSGAEAIENGIKAAFDRIGGGKYAYAFEDSFHGRTLGTLSLTKSKPVYTRHYPQISGVETVPFCDCRDYHGTGACSCGFFTDEGSRLRSSLAPEGGHIEPSEVGFLILEPVQGVGGYKFPNPVFMREVDAVCGEYDITLIVDEIQSGVGRTGKMWASDHYDLEPDVITSAKALRVGATIAKEDVFPAEKNRLGSTWGGGDLLSSMAGVFTLDAIQDHDLLAHGTTQGEQIKERLRKNSPAHVEDVRGLGLMLAVEFDTPDRRNTVVGEALKRGMLTLGCGKKTLRLLPPLDVTDREVEMGTEILNDAIEAAG